MFWCIKLNLSLLMIMEEEEERPGGEKEGFLYRAPPAVSSAMEQFRSQLS
jgi:hypothetical protein